MATTGPSKSKQVTSAAPHLIELSPTGQSRFSLLKSSCSLWDGVQQKRTSLLTLPHPPRWGQGPNGQGESTAAGRAAWAHWACTSGFRFAVGSLGEQRQAAQYRHASFCTAPCSSAVQPSSGSVHSTGGGR